MTGSTRRGDHNEKADSVDWHRETPIDSKTEAQPDRLVPSANPERQAAMNVTPIRRAHAEPEDEAVLGHEANARLGRQLKELYEKVARDPVPDRFFEILAQLEKQKKQN